MTAFLFPSFLRRWRPVLALLGGLALFAPVMAFAATPVPPPPGRGLFMDLVATVRDSKVRVSFYQSTRFWQSPTGKAKDPKLVLRIYRKEVPSLVFGIDYEEILNDLRPVAADLIWNGPLPAINERKYEFTDEHVQPGHTYVYWVSSDQGDAPTGPKAARVRDPQTFWPQDETERRMAALAARYPQLVSESEIGRTVLGRPIHALRIGNRERCIALVGAVHAGESGPELIVPALERILAEHPEVLREVGIVAVPTVNIDQRQRLAEGYPYYLRKNAAGVDINRNFAALWGEVSYAYGLISADPEAATYFGPRPVSEPEDVAITALVAQTKPLALFSFHCVAALTGTDFVRSTASAGDAAYTQKCEDVAKVYVEAAAGPTPGPHSRLFCTGGSLPTLMWKEYGAPAFDLEGTELAPFGDMPTAEQMVRFRAMHARGILATLRFVAQKP
ncbi:MAG: hypothetical protein JSS11_09130 [Verrucomicrobia bacterium]|nr:hypothetical protein [Verrucomicrobiota bacterium]